MEITQNKVEVIIMKIGFLNACLNLDLEEEIIPWANEEGFQAMEIGGMHAGFFRKEFVDDIKEILVNAEFEISALGSFRNHLKGDIATIERNFKELRNSIDTAHALEIPIVTTFVGMNNQLDYGGNLELFDRFWIPELEYAQELGIKIAIENCPMKKDYSMIGGNLMFCPGIMEDLFNRSPENFGLNFDPSHLVWQLVDINKIARKFATRIFHVHVKDTEINEDVRAEQGVFAEGTYTFRIPGEGMIDWASLIRELGAVNYDGTLSIELEDPNYCTDVESVKEGLLKSKQYLEVVT